MLVVLVLGLVYKPNYSTCQSKLRSDKKIKIGSTKLTIQEANTEQAREKGLGGQSCIPANQAMLFTYSRPGYYQFWMKGMKFPIDIIWINSDKKVIQVSSNISPNTFPETFASDQPAQYILETKANQAGKLHITRGTSLEF
jgi:uncharacterized membrane protein (UPF0127 family)